MKSKACIIIACILTAAIYTYSVIKTGQISDDIRQCIQRCINVIIPSLFIYMVLASVIIGTGIYRFLFLPLVPVSKYVFRLPSSLFFVFVMGNICGYPIGASLIEEMYQKGEIDKKTANTMLAISYGGGPSFLIGMVGIALYNSETAGLIVFISCISANAVLAVILNRITKPSVIDTKSFLTKPDIISIISSSAKNIFKICAVIVSFSIVCTLLNDILGNTNKDTAYLIKSFFEITNVTNISAPSVKMLPIIAMISSLGGICILLQLKAITKLSLKPIILSRIIACPLSAVFCILYTELLGLKLYAPASAGYTVSFENDSCFGLILTAILLVFLIFTTEKADD